MFGVCVWVCAVLTQNVAPVASFTATPASGTPTLTVNVDASASTDPDGTIASYVWTWDDGSAPSSGVTASHAFMSTGTYRIYLIVTDNGGASATHAIDVDCITTANVPPAIGSWASSTLGSAPMTVTFGSIAHDDTGPLTQRWDAGDGSPFVTYPDKPNHAGTLVTHTYTIPGTYFCTLRVSDPEGVWREFSVGILVVPAPAGGSQLGDRACGATGAEVLLVLAALVIAKACRR